MLQAEQAEISLVCTRTCDILGAHVLVANKVNANLSYFRGTIDTSKHTQPTVAITHGATGLQSNAANAVNINFLVRTRTCDILRLIANKFNKKATWGQLPSFPFLALCVAPLTSASQGDRPVGPPITTPLFLMHCNHSTRNITNVLLQRWVKNC